MTTSPLRDHSESNQSIQRAVAILWAVAHVPGGVRVSDLAQAVSLPYSSVFRLVRTLVEERLLAWVPGTRRLVLGTVLIHLTSGHLPRDELLAAGRAHVESLATRLGEAVELSAVVNPHASDAGHAIEILVRVEANFLLQATPFRIRSRVPLHATSIGKILLAHRSDSALDKLLSGPLERFAGGTVTEAEILRAQVDKARKTGIAECVDELEDGVSAVSTGIHQDDGQLVGILNVDGPTQRLDEKRRAEIARLVTETACAIEADLPLADRGKSPGGHTR